MVAKAAISGVWSLVFASTAFPQQSRGNLTVKSAKGKFHGEMQLIGARGLLSGCFFASWGVVGARKSTASRNSGDSYQNLGFASLSRQQCEISRDAARKDQAAPSQDRGTFSHGKTSRDAGHLLSLQGPDFIGLDQLFFRGGPPQPLMSMSAGLTYLARGSAGHRTPTVIGDERHSFSAKGARSAT